MKASSLKAALFVCIGSGLWAATESCGGIDRELFAGAAMPVCSADLLTDRDHCGACDRSCEGGVCVNGSCVQEDAGAARSPLASGQATPGSVTVDDANVYWTTNVPNGQVWVCPLTGCASPRVLAPSEDRPSALVQAGEYLAWLSGGSLRFVSKSGGTPLTVESQGNTGGLVWGSPTFYVSKRENGTVYQCPLKEAGRCFTEDNVASPEGIAHLDGQLFVISARRTLYRCLAGRCGFAPFATNVDQAAAIEVDRERAYWLELGQGGRVIAKPWSTPPDAGGIDVWASGGASAIAQDGSSLFVANRASGRITRVSKFDRTETTFAQDEPGIVQIAAGPRHLCWTNDASGKVWCQSK